MTSHRTTLLTLASLTVMSFATPSSAFAGSLLSGYGGPGEGNQAILGSALLGGAGGDSGSSGGSSGSTGSSLSGAAGVGAQAGQSSAAPTGSNERGSTARGQGGRSARGAGEASGDAANAYPASSVGETSRLATGGLETLGLSGEDLLYMLLTLGALAFVGVLTRRLTQTTGPEGA
jgi:hypothetical protein